MIVNVGFSKVSELFFKVTRSDSFKSLSAALVAVSLVVFSFQGFFVAAKTVFTPVFFFMPLYFVITCAMIVLGIQSLEPAPSR